MSLLQTCFTASLILFPRPLKITANLVSSPLGQKYTLREQDLLLAPGYPDLVLFSELPGLTNSYVFIASSENGRGLWSTLSLWCSINLPRLAHFWKRRSRIVECHFWSVSWYNSFGIFRFLWTQRNFKWFLMMRFFCYGYKWIIQLSVIDNPCPTAS